VAVPHPSYPLFSFLSDLSDVALAPYHLRYGRDEGWRLDAESLEEAIDPLTRAIITVSPRVSGGLAR
jgi:aspartate/methionine/tyrosine aminotransferase